MRTFLDDLYAFSSFFINVLGDIATWFIGNPLGLLIIGLSLFGVVLSIIFSVFHVFKK